MDDPSPAGGHDARARLDRTDRTPVRARRRRRRLRRGDRAGARGRVGQPACSRATSACGRATQRVGEAIAERLGWLDAPAHFAERIAGLEGFGDAVVDEGYETVVVAGMGGSSLAPDVLGRTFGNLEGYLALRILDSTDPAYVSATLDDLDPLRTLVIIASKSGTTTEPNAFLAYAWARAEAALEQVPHHRYEGPGAYFAAITDPGRSAEAIAHHDDFREVFINPPDIGGRYSALTYVGLVPASLIGIDLDALLASASAMLGACREPDPARQPGRLARSGDRDAGQGRARQADLPGRRRARRVRGVGRAAHRREHRQARGRDRAGRPRADRHRRRVRPRPRVRPDLAGRHGWRGPGDAWHRRSRRPGIRSSGSSSPTRSTSAPSSSAGRSRPPSRARSWASTRSTSPTSRRPSS